MLGSNDHELKNAIKGNTENDAALCCGMTDKQATWHKLIKALEGGGLNKFSGEYLPIQTSLFDNISNVIFYSTFLMRTHN